ncbi:hypothetical protein [Salinibaculum salinum]|uniref:hypothetical protein n=1 Tax=Salinibaculum salinum TaxID=3131996 RepID=UPI0030ED1DAC
MPDVSTRRELLTVLGTGTATVLAGCSGGDSSSDATSTDQPAATGTETPSDTGGTTTAEPGQDSADSPSLTDGSIAERSLPAFAGIIPDVDPLVVGGWNTGGRGVRVTDYPDTPSDTLRFNAMVGRIPSTAMGAYLLTSQEGAFVSQLWTAQLEAGNEPDWATVVAGVGAMYGSGIEVQTTRETLSATESEYERIADDQNRLVVRGPEGDVVGVTPEVFAFVPASQRTFAFSPVDRLRALLETALGNRQSLPERDQSLRRALVHTPSAGILHVAHSRDGPLGDVLTSLRETDTPGFSVAGYATGYTTARTAVSHIDIGGEDQPSPATGTIVYDDSASIDGETLTANVGNHGAGREYVQDGTMVQATCEYARDDLSVFLGSGQ